MRVELCLVRRFARAFLFALALLAAFYALLLVRTGVSRGADDAGLLAVLEVMLLELMRTADVLLAVAAPAAVLHVLVGLRRAGILLSLGAAGLPPSRLRWTILGLGVAVAVLAVGAHEVAAGAMAGDPATSPAWREGDHWGWFVERPGIAPGEDLVLFEADGLAVWRVGGVERTGPDASIELDGATRLAGGGPPPASFPGLGPPPRTFRTAPPSRWGDAPGGGATILAFLLQTLVGPSVFVLCAYLALVVARTRLAFVWLAYLLLLPAVATLMITVVVMLRHTPGWGTVAAAACGLVVGGAVLGLDRRLARQGLRL